MPPKFSTEEELWKWIDSAEKKNAPFNFALGRFISMFSALEAKLQAALWKFAGVSPPSAQAVFSGVRVDGAMQFINRLADAQNWDKARKDELQFMFAQLGIINRLRNDLLHYGASWQELEDETFVITNKPFVHVPDRIQETRITPEILKDATFDTAQILLRLILFAWSDEYPEARKQFDPVLSTSWRYKPPPQHPQSRKTPKRSRTLSPQPPSSRGSQ